MDARVEQFHRDAQQPRSAKSAKEIDKLRKFLFKNQEFRFTDGSQQQLFMAVLAHAAHDLAQPGPEPLALPLVEDALKMPFTVFTTGHKSKLLKTLDKLNALANGGEGGGQLQQQQQQQEAPRLTLLDVTAEHAEVMDDAGDTQRIELAACDEQLMARLRAAFEADEEGELLVELGSREGRQAIVRLLGEQEP